jgi:hypothetical protein
MCCVRLFNASRNINKVEAVRATGSVRPAAAVVAIVASLSAVVFPFPALSLPSFARQTGQPCGACHIDYPSLTPFGRQFKLNGYTAGGGRYRTTLFPTQNDPMKALADYSGAGDARRRGTALSTVGTDASDVWVPPVSMMAIAGYTHTQAPQDPTGSPYRANDNVVVSPVSFFYGGAITQNIGAFAQVTYNGAPFGAQDPADRFATFQWTWDNVDVRYANRAIFGNVNVTYGITVNNNPSVQDPWNTTPAWSFPYAVSSVAPTPAVGTLIDGTFAAHVLGAGAYVWINNLLYLELSGYRTVIFRTQTKLGADPFGAPGMFDGVSPYWRVALEPHWDNNWFQFGAFGMIASVHPWTFATGPDGSYANQTFPQTDRYTDVGFDMQYQYQGRNYWVTLRGSYIRENQTLDASFANGLSSNPTSKLNTLKALASLAYGNDNRIVLTGQYFNTWGTSDPTLYAGLASGLSPNSNGYIAEIAYIPFIGSNAPGWPWANVRLGLQYTYYNKFDGATVGARDNNTLFLYAWFAM